MPQLDVSTFLPQLFWLILSFGSLYFILSKFCLPSLSFILNNRAHTIAKILAMAEKNKEEAAKIKNEYEKLLAETIKIKDSMILEAIKEINNMMDHKISEHELELKIIENNSLEKIAAFEKSSLKDVEKIAQEATTQILENFLNTKLDKKLIDKVVKENARSEHAI